MPAPSLPQPFKISQIKDENTTTKTFILDGALEATPGQFVMAWLPQHQDKPFSLANTNPLSLTIAAVGPLSRALHDLTVGDYMWIRGPLGQGYQWPSNTLTFGHILLIGGGYGVAPLLFLAQQAISQGYQVSVIIGAKGEADLLLANEFRVLGANIWLTTEDGSTGHQGVVTDVLPWALADKPKPQMVYTCGPIGMLQAVATQCHHKSIPFQLSWEAHIRCGIGLCGSCEVGQGWLTCLDGPTFSFDPTEMSPAEALNFQAKE